jgi:hypothetical protein
MNRSLLFFFFLLLATINVKSQDVEFVREDITFQLDTLFFTVDGDYYFRNATDHPVNATLFYPFANTDKGMTVDSVLVYDLSKNDFIQPGTGRDDGIFFNLRLNGHETREVNVYYRQHHDGHNATYILTSTAYWKKPLAIANYSLITDTLTIAFDSLFYPPDHIFTAGNNKIYEWKKQEFMPVKDFTVWFRCVPVKE